MTVFKTVQNDNGGLLDVADFPLFVGSVPVTSGVANNINAGVYVVSETNQPGYLAGAWGGDCAADGTITLNVGDNKVCTITNDDIPPDLNIVKTAIDPLTIPGYDMGFSITVSNLGGGDALDVTLTDPLPPEQQSTGESATAALGNIDTGLHHYRWRRDAELRHRHAGQGSDA